MRRAEWTDVGKGAVVRDRGETDARRARTSPDDLLVVAAGGPAAASAPSFRPWFGNKTKAVTAAIGACVDCEPSRLKIMPVQSGAKPMILRVFDPTNERKRPAANRRRARLRSKGKTIGFISNGKEGTAGYFAHLDRMLREEFGVADVVFRGRSNYSAPADRISSTKSRTGRPSSPASAIEAVAHRAVCTTLSQLNDKVSPL